MTRQTVKDALKDTLDEVLDNAVGRAGGVPGVVAMITDREGNIYEGAAGVRELGKETPMTTDTVFVLFSTTKAITGTALMQLVEEGKVRLDDPVKKYVPEIAEIKVLEGFDADGQPKLREPRTDITIDMLMLHTAGFGYEFFSHEDRKYREKKREYLPFSLVRLTPLRVYFYSSQVNAGTMASTSTGLARLSKPYAVSDWAK